MRINSRTKESDHAGRAESEPFEIAGATWNTVVKGRVSSMHVESDQYFVAARHGGYSLFIGFFCECVHRKGAPSGWGMEHSQTDVVVATSLCTREECRHGQGRIFDYNLDLCRNHPVLSIFRTSYPSKSYGK